MENRLDENLYCHYSDLPSPMGYDERMCMDYESMGNYGRFPMDNEKKKTHLKRLTQKILLYITTEKPTNL